MNSLILDNLNHWTVHLGLFLLPTLSLKSMIAIQTAILNRRQPHLNHCTWEYDTTESTWISVRKTQHSVTMKNSQHESRIHLLQLTSSAAELIYLPFKSLARLLTSKKLFLDIPILQCSWWLLWFAKPVRSSSFSRKTRISRKPLRNKTNLLIFPWLYDL